MYLALLLTLLVVCFVEGKEDSVDLYGDLDGKVGIKFLVTVNDTWDENGCIDTIATPMLISGVKYNLSDAISVGSCDRGPLRFNVQQLQGQRTSMVWYKLHIAGQAQKGWCAGGSDLLFLRNRGRLTPTCSLQWNGTYLVPKSTNPRESLLPGCFTMDSREGYHMTYYWFYILEWAFY